MRVKKRNHEEKEERGHWSTGIHFIHIDVTEISGMGYNEN